MHIASLTPSPIAKREKRRVAKNVVLVHGEWAGGSTWSKVIPRLEADGLHVTAIQMPLTSFDEDVAAARRALALEDGPVLLVGHSYGGAVITEVGNDPKVVGLVYLAAFAPDAGESALGLTKSFHPVPETAEMRPDGAGFFKLTRKGIMVDYGADLTEPEKRNLVATQSPTSMKSLGGSVTTPAWKSKPSWYMVATNDRAISPELEMSMARKIGAETIRITSSHAVILSHPDEVATFVSGAASGKTAARASASQQGSRDYVFAPLLT